MSIKTPIYLKTGSPKKSKKVKLRDVLSADMISPPLGDFRHRSHVGKSGESDTFGDVSFLQGQGDLLSTLSKAKESDGRAPPKPPRLHLGESDNLAAETFYPMPAMTKATDNQPSTDQLSTIQHIPSVSLQEVLPCNSQTVDENHQQNEGLEDQQCPTETLENESSFSSLESMFSFKVDLGPSILEDILKVMENHKS